MPKTKAEDGAGDRPVRKIPIGRRSMTGSVTIKGEAVWHESDLECDLLAILRMDRTVMRVVHQPMRIAYRTVRGTRTYVPDFLVIRHDGSRTIHEVKYRDELRARWSELRPRLRAAVAQAKATGARFKVLTEVEIRTPLLDNARFLARFRMHSPPVDDPIEEHLVATLQVLGTSTPQGLLEAAYAFRDNRLRAIPTLWRLVGSGRIGAFVSAPLTMETEIWVNQGRGVQWPGPHSLIHPLAYALHRRFGSPEPTPVEFRCDAISFSEAISRYGDHDLG